MRYDIEVQPDYDKQFTSGANQITYKVVQEKHPDVMQIDLQEPLVIDRILFDDATELQFKREGNVYWVNTLPQELDSEHTVKIFFSGNPHVAVRPPWDDAGSVDDLVLVEPHFLATVSLPPDRALELKAGELARVRLDAVGHTVGQHLWTAATHWIRKQLSPS